MSTSSPSNHEELVESLPPLAQYRRHGLKVTDFSDQAWCEQQMAFTLKHGREQTETMRQGSIRHEELHAEITDIIEVKPETREDWWGLRFLNAYNALLQLKRDGLCREIPVFGQVQGIWLVGVIDQLHYDEHRHLRLIDTKTRRNPSLPSEAQKLTTRLQLMLYKHLFDQLTQQLLPLDAFFTELNLHPHLPFSSAFLEILQQLGFAGQTLAYLAPLALEQFHQSDSIADPLEIRYEWQEDRSYLGSDTFPFKPNWLQNRIQQSLRFWHGERSAMGVSSQEKWKCRFCQFQSQCPFASPA